MPVPTRTAALLWCALVVLVGSQELHKPAHHPRVDDDLLPGRQYHQALSRANVRPREHQTHIDPEDDRVGSKGCRIPVRIASVCQYRDRVADNGQQKRRRENRDKDQMGVEVEIPRCSSYAYARNARKYSADRTNLARNSLQPCGGEVAWQYDKEENKGRKEVSSG